MQNLLHVIYCGISKTMKFRIIFLLVCFLVVGWFVLPNAVLAHPGNTDSSGCHTCRTNCPDWGLYYGQYHCHQSKGYTQPQYPVTSTYGDYGTGYTEPYEPYTYPYGGYSYPSTPSCPIFSTYSSLSGSCKCNYGYVVSGSKCISQDSYCQNIYGYNSEYDILTDNCECSYGYIANSSGTSCIYGNTYCHQKYGYYSDYKSYSKTCECDYGYELDSSGQCVDEDDTNYYSDFDYSLYEELLKESSTQKNTTSNTSSTPVPTSINPTKGTIDDIFTINGIGFGTRGNGDQIGVGNKNAEIISWSDTEIKFRTDGIILTGTYSVVLFKSNIHRIHVRTIEIIKKTQPYVPAPSPPVIKPKPEPIEEKPPPPKAVTPVEVTPVIKVPVTESTPTPQPEIIEKSNETNQTSKRAESRVSFSANRFGLAGNELLRKCSSFDCPVIKWGSTDGEAEVLEQQGEWFKVLVIDKGVTTEGWFNETLIPDEEKEKFTDRNKKEEQVETEEEQRGFFGRFWKRLFSWF